MKSELDNIIRRMEIRNLKLNPKARFKHVDRNVLSKTTNLKPSRPPRFRKYKPRVDLSRSNFKPKEINSSLLSRIKKNIDELIYFFKELSLENNLTSRFRNLSIKNNKPVKRLNNLNTLIKDFKKLNLKNNRPVKNKKR